MLRFADRMFYKVTIFCHCQPQKPLTFLPFCFVPSILIVVIFFLQDWWNSTSFANYYRTWNVVVHDWLYYYMYLDFLWVSRYRRMKKELQMHGQFLIIHSRCLLSAVCVPDV